MFLIIIPTIKRFPLRKAKEWVEQQTKENTLPIGDDSQEIPPGDDYKDFLKNNLNKEDLISKFNEFVHLEVARFCLG